MVEVDNLVYNLLTTGKPIMLLRKLRGRSAPVPPAPDGRRVIMAWLGGVLAISVLSNLSDLLHVSMILGSFGASCVLVFGFPDLPFSQPRNVVTGHLISTGVGLLCLKFLGPYGWSLALAVGTAIALMMMTRTVHPPAGSNPVIVFLTQADWGVFWFPTLGGSVLLVAVALLLNNMHRKQAWPEYW